MIYAKTPWFGKTPNDLMDKIEKLELKFPELPVVSDKMKKLIKSMLGKIILINPRN